MLCVFFYVILLNSQNIPLKQVFPMLQVDKVGQFDQGQQVASCGISIWTEVHPFPGYINAANSIITKKEEDRHRM